MKKILSLLGTITLVGTSTTSLVACNTLQEKEYTPEELEHLKLENQVNTDNQQIKDNLEWIAPQEKPFNTVDNKYYFVVWRGDKNANWRIIKFQNNQQVRSKNIDEYDIYNLAIVKEAGFYIPFDLAVNIPKLLQTWLWRKDNGTYFKSVYRWNLDTTELNLDINNNGNIKVN